ncbi:MAG: hypothetical protein R2685_15935 [Candidatus Nitrosocosmicus sp.]|nr:hypothetical protein [Candidatus Nitrosocosmicus sp.]
MKGNKALLANYAIDLYIIFILIRLSWITMPMVYDFPKSYKVMGRHRHPDGEHYHFVWGPGRTDAETSTSNEVQDAYKARGEEYVGLGVHGTMVAVGSVHLTKSYSLKMLYLFCEY